MGLTKQTNGFEQKQMEKKKEGKSQDGNFSTYTIPIEKIMKAARRAYSHREKPRA